MSLKKASVAAAIAVSMASTPVLAQTAQTSSLSAAPLSVAARSGAAMSGQASELRGGFIIPLIAIVAIVLGVLAATSGSDRPHSP